MKKGIFLVLAVFIVLLSYGFYVHKTNDGVEFCQSCHVSPGKILHERENNHFSASKDGTTDLAGFHKQQKNDFTCLTCHKGHSLKGELLNDFSAFVNLGKYLLGNFEPDKKLRFPMENDLCLDCHPLRLPREGDKTFHGYDAHKQPFPVACVSCHSAHIVGKSNNFFINYAFAIKICKKCHLSVTSEKFKKIFVAREGVE